MKAICEGSDLLKGKTRRHKYFEYNRAWRKTHKDSVRNSRKKYLQTHPWAKTFNAISGRCSSKTSSYYKRGIINSLNTDDVKFLWFRDGASFMRSPSIDRINGKGNYTRENCRFIEHELNVPVPKPVLQIKDGVVIKKWKSINSLACGMKVLRVDISRALNHGWKVHGFEFKYPI